ncbi:hypothetical protein [Planomicrobium sp. CPCC 101079]|uniref:hypothetical protein n=1 Tax=Planomicrobium sp. CPCC 101079 TaxID=2599618 RepID=UPI0011B43DC5|nr:hypothetical protein [Planomicrobium sp. CPCC 101079]TWT01795.1 hypothetical protein FQV28_14245 [Planomicrobium sp. CPCC 101079]
MKKGRLVLIALLILVLGAFGAYKFKMYTVEKAVLNHLLTEENIPEDRIVQLEGFIANLPGERNWMVMVKLKEEEKTYSFFKDENDQVILESSVINGYVEVYPDGM